MGKIIGVVSLKGGVGKTSSVVSLGHAFSGFGKKVLLVDGNLSAPNLGMHLNVYNPEKSLHDVLQRKVECNDAVCSLEDFDLIPSGSGDFNKDEIEYFSLKKKLGGLKRKYDVILIDSSPNLNDETLAVMLASDEIIVVATPDRPTLETTIKAINLAKQRGANISGLILNKVYDKNFEVSLREVESVLSVPVLAVIPHDINFLKALAEFKSPTEIGKNSEASEEFRKLAGALLGEKYKPVRLWNFFRWINPRRQDVNRTIYYESVFG